MIQSISNANHLDSNLIQPIDERQLSSIDYNLPYKVVSVRKSGTNLMKKLMGLIGAHRPTYQPQLHADLIGGDEFNKNTNYIITIRDPRDMLVSLANWAVNPTAVANKKRRGAFTEHENQKYLRLKAMTTQQRVNRLLLGESDVKCGGYENVLLGMKKNPKTIHIIKFEDLIGSDRGGAAKDVQLKTIHKIAMICGRNFNRAKLYELSQAMIGGSGTYTNLEKKVGQWETIFTADDIRMVKQQYNKYILAFGYETDPDWDVPYLEKLAKQPVNQKHSY